MPIPPLESVAKMVGIYDQLGSPLTYMMAASSRPAVQQYVRQVNQAGSSVSKYKHGSLSFHSVTTACRFPSSLKVLFVFPPPN